MALTLFVGDMGTVDERAQQCNVTKDTTVQLDQWFRDVIVESFLKEREPRRIRCPNKVVQVEEMVQNGILKQVEHSEWATPLIVVPKPGGKVQICGDCKVTVNPQLDINQYPFPKSDTMFHMLHGGQMFSRMDLSKAYANRTGGRATEIYN